jgi:hypothetical protein
VFSTVGLECDVSLACEDRVSLDAERDAVAMAAGPLTRETPLAHLQFSWPGVTRVNEGLAKSTLPVATSARTRVGIKVISAAKAVMEDLTRAKIVSVCKTGVDPATEIGTRATIQEVSAIKARIRAVIGTVTRE